jgi:hypothetical protein
MEIENNFTLSGKYNTGQSNNLDTYNSKSSNTNYNNKFISNTEEKDFQRGGGYSQKLTNKRANNKSISYNENSDAEPNKFSKVTDLKKKNSAKNITTLNSKSSPGLVPKKSINTVKNSLYEALKNINKELNVKIENKEQNRVEYSLMNFVDNNTFSQSEKSYETEGEENFRQREDGFARRKSKKIDLDSVLVNFNNEDEVSLRKSMEKIHEVDESKIISIHENNTHNTHNTNINELQFSHHFENIHHGNGNGINFDLYTEEKDKKLIEILKKNNVVQMSYNYIPNASNKNLSHFTTSGNHGQIEFSKLLEFLKIKDEELNNANSQIENFKKEIDRLKNELAEKNSASKILDSRKEELEREYKLKLKEHENGYKSVHSHNIRIEKENVILKNELSNAIKYKNINVKNFNEEIEDLSKMSKKIFENFLATYNNESEEEKRK